jgi:hypothetical protein
MGHGCGQWTEPGRATPEELPLPHWRRSKRPGWPRPCSAGISVIGLGQSKASLQEKNSLVSCRRLRG